MSILEEVDDHDILGLSPLALGNFVSSLGGSVVCLQETYRNYGTMIADSGLFGGLLLPLLQNKTQFIEKLTHVGITQEFHQEMIFAAFGIEKEKRERDQSAAMVVATSGTASENKAPLTHNRPSNVHPSVVVVVGDRRGNCHCKETDKERTMVTTNPTNVRITLTPHCRRLHRLIAT